MTLISEIKRRRFYNRKISWSTKVEMKLEQEISFYLKYVKTPALDFDLYQFFHSLKGVGRINHFSALLQASDVSILALRQF